MIQANELRIGNVIYLQNKPIKVNIDTLNRILNPEYSENIKFKDQYKPIELTSDIISKTHFYYDSDSESFQISDCTLKLYDYDDEGFMCVIFGNESHFIKYLHQLQNLYFALTGQELEINL